MLEIGEKRNMLTYLGGEYTKNSQKIGSFLCDCGTKKDIRIISVEKEITKSCGCMTKNKYGVDSKTWERLYGVYSNMKKRCYDINNNRYYAYGAKGVIICNEWLNSFHAFADYALKNGWSVNLSIERIDVNGNYEPSNCAFITMKEQARNKTSCVYLTKDGVTKCVEEWCENMTKLTAKSARKRIYRGITDVDIILYDGDLRDLKSNYIANKRPRKAG